MILCKLVIALIPVWAIKRLVLVALFKYDIHSSARIGYSYVFPTRLYMGPGSIIGHCSVCKGLAALWMGQRSTIGNLNWITGLPISSAKSHYVYQPKRDPQLVLGEHSAITSRHLIDCTDKVVLGPFSILAGFCSQILTHSVNIQAAQQRSMPVIVGRNVFVGTGAIILAGVKIPSFSVIAAGSVLCKPLLMKYSLYAGVPARLIKTICPDSKYFTRSIGFID